MRSTILDSPDESVDHAKYILAQNQKERLEACQQELNELLQRHGCQLSAQVVVTQDGRLVANVVLVDAQ